MEVATLQPQDCLQRNHFHQRRPLLSPPNNKPRRNVNFNTNTNPNVNGNFNSRSNRKRRNSTSPPPSSNGSTTHAHKAQHQRPKSPPSPPQHGQVRILKRGEQITLSSPPPPPPPQPEPMSEPADVLPMPVPRMVDGFYAGSAFVTSPAPSEVPLPAFFTKRNCGFASGDVHNQEIACELRRVLKLH